MTPNHFLATDPCTHSSHILHQRAGLSTVFDYFSSAETSRLINDFCRTRNMSPLRKGNPLAQHGRKSLGTALHH